MEEDGQSGLDSPTTQSNPGTPLPLPAPAHQMTFDTQLSADSVEWCPVTSSRQILVCGTYELVEGKDRCRIGCIHLLRSANRTTLESIQRIDVPAILDSKWCQHELGTRAVLGTVDAGGWLQLYGLRGERLKSMTGEMVGEDCLALSLDWFGAKYPSEHPSIAVSDSKGQVSVFRVGPQELRKSEQWKAHEHEAWVVAFDYWTSDVVYSGGDDCRLRVWDIRQPQKTATFTSRQHSMGVTSIQGNRWNSNVIASGSYDERICIWDVRRMNSPTSVVESGGGVWRIKWHPQGGRYLLAACMHGGAVIVDCHTFQTPQMMTTYLEHGSMVYGVDWQVASSSASPLDPATIASCSFYDHTVHLWTLMLENQTI